MGSQRLSLAAITTISLACLFACDKPSAFTEDKSVRGISADQSIVDQTRGPDSVGSKPDSDSMIQTSGNGQVVNTLTIEQVQDLCANGVQQTSTQEIFFPDPKVNCLWGQNGNLEKRNLFIQARREDTVSLANLRDKVVCDVNFIFPEQYMHFDDEIFMTFDGIVLLASNKRYVTDTFMERVGKFYRYNWSKLVGASWSSQSSGLDKYCVGEANALGSCGVPASDTVGKMTLNIDSSVVQDLFLQAKKLDRYDFAWITTGDNDDSTASEMNDCRHSDYKFLVEFKTVSQ